MQFIIKDPDERVQIDIDKNNLIRIHKMSIIIIILEIFMISLSLFISIPKYYQYSYILLLGLVILFYYLTSDKFHKYKMFEKIMIEVALYIFSFWGIVIAVFDASRDIAPFVYIINVSFVVCFYIFTPKTSLIFNILNVLILFIVLQYLNLLSLAIVINFSFFHIVLILISIDKYKSQVSSFKDKEQLKIANKELSILSTIDQLSGCKNRRGLFYELEKYENEVVFTLLTDIDDFKEVNDKYGHDIGDLFIVNFAKILQANFGVSKVFRIGGDEFFIISDCEPLDSCLKKFDITRKEISDVSFIKNEGITMTISAGYSYKKLTNIEKFDKLYKELDVALYSAKAMGKNIILRSEK